MLALVLAANEIGRGEVVSVLAALIVCLMVGLVLWLFEPTKPFAGPAAILVFLLLLLLLLL